MGCIYKVTNKVNGKIYVGQTRRSMPERWKEHLYYSHHKNRGYNSALHSAIRKYGDDAFYIEIIEECERDLLEEREIYWIKKLDSYNSGYNLSIGGRGWNKCSDRDILELWQDGKSLKEIALLIPLHQDTISKRLRQNGVTQQEITSRGRKRAYEKMYKPIYQYDLDGNFIRGFKSLREAERSIGGQRIKVGGRQKTIYGYQWRKFAADKIDPVTYSELYRGGGAKRCG